MITLEGGRGVECMMPRRLAQPCPLSLYSLSAHAVVYLNTAVITFEVDRGVKFMMPRCLAQPWPLSLSSLPLHADVYELCPLGITFEVGRGVGWSV